VFTVILAQSIRQHGIHIVPPRSRSRPRKFSWQGSDKTHARRRRREVAEEKAAEEARKAAARFGIDNTNTADADRHLVASQSYCEDIRQTRRKLPGEGSENTVKRRERRQCAEERAAKKARKAVAHSGNVDADPALTSRMDAGLPRTTFSPQLPRPEAHHLYTTILSALANRSQQCSDMEEEHHLVRLGGNQVDTMLINANCDVEPDRSQARTARVGSKA
jgi:hypothetical protein